MERNWNYGTSYLNDKTGVIVIGITGREASQVVTETEAIYPGITKAGVTPGRGGKEVAGVPVFNTVKEALEDPALKESINTGLVYVPPTSVKDAVYELIDNGIKVIYIVTEHVPIKDTAEFYSYAKEKGVKIVGPTSLGAIVPKIGRIGAVGGKDPFIAYQKPDEPGSYVILSKSGGLTTTTAEMIKRRGFGIYTAIALGGDVISCTTYADVLPELEEDPNVKGVVLLGEPGGSYEEQAAQLVINGKFTKPLVPFIGGRFQDYLAEGVSFGHAGAVVERGMGKASDKIRKFLEAAKYGPVNVAFFYHEIPQRLLELGCERDLPDTTGDIVKPLYSTLEG